MTGRNGEGQSAPGMPHLMRLPFCRYPGILKLYGDWRSAEAFLRQSLLRENWLTSTRRTERRSPTWSMRKMAKRFGGFRFRISMRMNGDRDHAARPLLTVTEFTRS